MADKVCTFIMAGGRGERLHPLTRDRAKPAVPFGGIYRIIDITLSNCINSGLRKLHILSQYKSISLDRHIRMGWSIFAGELGEYIDIIPAQQRIDDHWYQGTADSIYQNIYSIEMEKPELVLVLAGDHIYKMNYLEMVKFHREHNAEATVGVVEVPKERSEQLGVVEVDGLSRVSGFSEKPHNPRTLADNPSLIYGSMGIYLFNTDILKDELTLDARNTSSSHDFGKNVLPSMIKKGRRVVAYNFKDENKKEAKYWRDIGTIDAYYEANMDLAQVDPIFNLYDNEWPIRTYQYQLPPAKFVFAQEHKGGRLGTALDSMVSGGCIVSGGKVQRSILSPNVRINSYVEVHDSILMEGVEVGRSSKIKRAIIDKDVIIPQNVEIGYDLHKDKKRFTVTDSGIVVVAKGTKID